MAYVRANTSAVVTTDAGEARIIEGQAYNTEDPGVATLLERFPHYFDGSEVETGAKRSKK